MSSLDHSKVTPISLGHVNAYLIETDRGHILVDTGMPNAGEKLDEAFEAAGVDPQSVQLIVLTHGHMDHVGCLAHVRQRTGAQVLCHRSLAERLAQGKMEPAVARGLLGRLITLLSGLTGSLEITKADFVVDDAFDLSPFGITGKVIHTPGHSASSLSILLGNGEALVGDLVRDQRSGEIGLGMFHEDEQVLFDSLDRVLALEPRAIYLSHGGCVDHQALKAFAEANRPKEA